MTFELFGFEVIPNESAYGLWLFYLRKWGIYEDSKRALLGIYYAGGEWIVNVGFLEYRF